MGYTKIITYGNNIEIYRYERELPNPRGSTGRPIVSATELSLLSADREGDAQQISKKRTRTERSARRAAVEFRRLVAANLDGINHPIFATFTFVENVQDVSFARSCFKTFTRNCRAIFGPGFKSISVMEFQRRGAIHFHALLWGCPGGTVESERSTRMVATLWGRGFIDLINTDGNIKIAGYFAKYMQKTFLDSRLFGRKAYVATSNVYRPIVDRHALIAPYLYAKKNGIDLSTAEICQEKEYNTQWLGRCNYQQYQNKVCQQ